MFFSLSVVTRWTCNFWTHFQMPTRMLIGTPSSEMTVSIVIGLWALISNFADAADWSYDASSPRGPIKWTKLFPTCAARWQSPINIDTHHLAYKAGLTAFNWTNYASIPKQASWTMINTGQNVHLSIDGHYIIEDGGLLGPYKAKHCVFHWGSDEQTGSEHTIDGRSFPAELQIVHFLADKESYDQAALHHNGILVLSFHFKACNQDNPALNHILNQLVKIQYPGDKVHLRPLPFLSLLPLNLNNYYRYEGSMSYPPCHQSVVWNVFQDHIDISLKQLKMLQSTVYTSGRRSVPPVLMQDTFRPVQPLSGRQVYSSDSDHASLLSTSVASPIGITLTVLVGFVLMFVVLNKVYGVSPTCCVETDYHVD